MVSYTQTTEFTILPSNAQIGIESPTGYILDKWVDQKGNEYDIDYQLPNTGYDTFLYPKWIETFNVTLFSNDENAGRVKGSGVYKKGAKITIRAIPESHYHFQKWSDEDTNSTREITVNENINKTAYFYIDTHTITVNAGTGGSVSGAGTYNYG